MVAITVILAAVIASFVLGLGGQTQTTPQASFSWDFEDSTNKTTITHDSGESVKAIEVFVRGTPNGTNTNINQQWVGSNSTTIGSDNAVASGDSFSLCPNSSSATCGANTDINASYDLRVVWQREEGDTSATLGEDTGPDV